jgi:Rrf2 family transcriptional regulator, cysteine metabolism repressor
MKLSTRTRYGMRLMVDLALHYGKGPVQLSSIAKGQDISDKYLEQIVLSLKNTGFIQAIRGAHGGYFLAREPKSITVKEIIECMEGALLLVDCVSGDECLKEQTCVTHLLWEKLSTHIACFLEDITLAELVEWKRNLTQAINYSI